MIVSFAEEAGFAVIFRTMKLEHGQFAVQSTIRRVFGT